MPVRLAAIFVAAFALEFSGVFWVHFSERNQVARLALCSALQACALLALLECVSVPERLVFVVGYATGAVVGLKCKRRWGLTG
jgi:hypothetical protein